MTFEEMVERLHVVMGDYNISVRNDLAFLGQIAWVFDLNVEFNLRDQGDKEIPSDGG